MKRFVLSLVCVAWLLAPALGQTPEEKKATIEYLRDLQIEDGGFLPAIPDPTGDKVVKSSLGATSGALRALKYFGGEPKDRAAAARFIASCFDRDSGGFADHPDAKPAVNTTAVGVMAAMEAGLRKERFRERAVNYLLDHAKSFEEIRIAAAGLEALSERPPQVERWLEQLAAMQNADGTFGKGDGAARATGGAVAAVLRLGGKVNQRENVLRALRQGQRSDGGFGEEGKPKSDLGSSYRILRSLVMLKEKPADPDALRAFIARCRNADGGYGAAPGQPSTVGATYMATIILHWLDAK